MTFSVFIRCNQKSRGGIRGTNCLPGSRAISGMAHYDISFSGDPRIKPLQKSFRGVAQSLQPNLSFANAPELHGHLSKGVDAACAKKLSNRSMS